MASFTELVSSLRQVFYTGRSKQIEWRLQQLKQVIKMIDENKLSIEEAMRKDLNKPAFESEMLEIQYVRNDCIYHINNLEEWVKPEKVKKNLMAMMDNCYIKREPFGVVLVIGAWNYPFQLTLLPVLGAIAAGNCVLLKPSEVSWNTAVLLEELFGKYFDNDCIRVVNGGVPETTALLAEKFDYIFYTGNSMVGKIVMQAATKHLTPVTLELGGKSPVYVDRNCDLEAVANRILWGKCINSGQTCIAPDYVLCSKDVQESLLNHFKESLNKFYPDGANRGDYCRIVADRHFNRVKKLMDSSGHKAIGGECNEADKYIAPTVLTDVKLTDPIMQEEIFGPVLPIINVENEDEAIKLINSREKPLSMYLFSKNKKLIQKILDSTSSGGVCVNDVLMQSSLPTLPFGGVGSSGMGGYHGKYTFDTFSHKRSVVHREQKMESLNGLRYPPYTDRKYSIVGYLMKRNIKRKGLLSYLPLVVFGTFLAVVLKALGVQGKVMSYLER